MQYENLKLLISSSSSSRRFFLSLPVDVQLSLHDKNDFIKTQQDLRMYADYELKNR